MKIFTKQFFNKKNIRRRETCGLVEFLHEFDELYFFLCYMTISLRRFFSTFNSRLVNHSQKKFILMVIGLYAFMKSKSDNNFFFFGF